MRFVRWQGDGMSEKQKSFCDQFVYIPQYGNGTHSLNVGVAAAIVLHRFASWARFRELAREPDNHSKFLIDASVLDFKAEHNQRAAQALHEERARKNVQAPEAVMAADFFECSDSD